MAATRSSRSRRMKSSPPVRWTHLNCGQRSKNSATSAGVISFTLFFCQMLHISQRKLQWYVATNVTLYGSAGDCTLAPRIAPARPAWRVNMDMESHDRNRAAGTGQRIERMDLDPIRRGSGYTTLFRERQSCHRCHSGQG